MTEQQDIQAHLSSLARDGQRVSSGQFTLDLERQLEKIGPLATEHPPAMFFWIIQGAVALGASAIKLRLLKDSLAIDVSLPQLPQELAQLEGFGDATAEGSGDLSQEGLQRLRRAVLWSRAYLKNAEAPLESVVEVRTGAERRRLRFVGTEALPEYDRVTGEAGFSWSIRSRSDRPKAQWLSTRLRLSLAAALPWRAAPCPVPVWLDGRPLNARGAALGFEELGTPTSAWGSRRNCGEAALDEAEPYQGLAHYHAYYLGPRSSIAMACRPPALLPALSYRLGRHSCRRPRPSSPVWRVERLEIKGEPGSGAVLGSNGIPEEGTLELLNWSLAGQSQQVWLKLSQSPSLDGFDSPAPWAARATLTRFQSGPNLVFLVSLGLVAAVVPLTTLPSTGWLAMIQADRLRTDASGLKPVDDQRYYDLLRWIQEEIKAIHYDQAAWLEQESQSRLALGPAPA